MTQIMFLPPNSRFHPTQQEFSGFPSLENTGFTVQTDRYLGHHYATIAPMRGPEGSSSSKLERLPSAEEQRGQETEALLQSVEWTLRHASRHAQRTMPDDEMATFDTQLADYANPCVWLLDCALRLLPDESHDHRHRQDTATFAESFLRAFDERTYSPGSA